MYGRKHFDLIIQAGTPGMGHVGLMTQIVRHNTSEPKIITEKEHWRLQRTKWERGK